MISSITRWSAGVMAICALAGCIGSNVRYTSAATPQKTYSRSLSVCRQWHHGRPIQRSRLAATEPHVASCLRRFGWHPDGTPTLEAVAPTPTQSHKS
jgi:hypothetical protein